MGRSSKLFWGFRAVKVLRFLFGKPRTSDAGAMGSPFSACVETTSGSKGLNIRSKQRLV